MMSKPFHAWLQCGHGSDAVENIIRLAGLVGPGLLQCGHGSDAVENHD